MLHVVRLFCTHIAVKESVFSTSVEHAFSWVTEPSFSWVIKHSTSHIDSAKLSKPLLVLSIGAGTIGSEIVATFLEATS